MMQHTVSAICHEMITETLTASLSEVDVKMSQLSDNFKNFASETKKQSDDLNSLIDIISVLQHEDSKVTMEQFTDMMKNHINQVIERILTISTNSMSLAFAMENTVKKIELIDKQVKKFESINAQTKMLALNVAIEASRAGEAGKGFQVVAKEVKNLSNEMHFISQDMSESLKEIMTTLAEGKSTLNSVASIDMTDSIRAKEDLGAIIKSFISQNQKIAHLTEQSSHTSDALSKEMVKIIMDMQFHDRFTQVVQNSVVLINHLTKMEAEFDDKPLESSQAIMELGNTITLQNMKNRLFEIAEYHGIITETQSVNGHIENSTSAAEDDIEFF